jgi:3,4-dihydroxy 2-butanone 4-phosphate synthase/GTP cyclohydrolase II
MRLEECSERVAGGEPAVITAEDRSHALLVAAAGAISPATLSALCELGRDLVVLAVDGDLARRLELTEGAPRGARRRVGGLTLTSPVDAAGSSTGGWSLAARAHTMRVAAAPGAGPSDLTVPGHVHTASVSADDPSAAPAALELARAAGHSPAVALCLLSDGRGRRRPASLVVRDPRLRGLPRASAEELRALALTRRFAQTTIDCALPTRLGSFRAVAQTTSRDGGVAVALVHGELAREREVLVHVHTACLFGDTFASRLCDCHARLERGAAAIRTRGAGVILYLKPVFDGDFACASTQAVDPVLPAALLRHAGVERLRLSDGDPDLAARLAALGLEVGDSERCAA